MKATVAVIGSLRFPPESIAAILPSLSEFVTATRAKDGCITYDVAIDPFDPGLIRFSELWPDRGTLERHLAAPHIPPWRAVSRQHGLLAREFTAYDVQGSYKVQTLKITTRRAPPNCRMEPQSARPSVVPGR